jgi:hypothetical protein
VWDTCTGSAFLEPVRLLRREHQSFQLRGHFPHSDTPTTSLFIGGSRLSDDELIALRLTQQLSTNHRVDESLYREAENSFGAKGLIDIAFLIGIYPSVCATLTMFAIPAPE